MEGETESRVGQVNGNHEDEELNRDGGDGTEPVNRLYPSLRSEDSGLGISASPSEQHIPQQMEPASEGMRMSTEDEGVWRKGGSVDTMTHCMQDILAFITTR